ncbi:MAG: hypothetical protein QXH30_00715, partial [Candidatus Bilamarchaeaceae archaeon]
VNSLDYEDVDSGVLYANLMGEEIYYITPPTDLRTAVLNVGQRDVELFESASKPAVVGYQEALEENGRTVRKTLSSDPFSFNLKLAEKSGASSYIIMDPAYPYNTISLFSYAKYAHSFVIFADKEHAEAISSFLYSKSTKEIIIFGAVDQEVKDSLISKGIKFDQIDNGDKYLDNVEILKRFYSKFESKSQILMADGTFYDQAVTQGQQPTLLVSNTVPKQTEDFLSGMVRNEKIKVAVLIKPDYTGMVYDLMKRINSEYAEKKFSVFVKMGQASAGQETPGPLDVYPLPSATLNVAFVGVQYNTAAKQLELILENKGSINTFTTSSIKVYSDGGLVVTLGDTAPQILQKGQKRGFSYPLTIANPGELSANITVYYSSSRLAYERGFNTFVQLGNVAFNDASQLEISKATYDHAADRVSIKVTNTGSQDVYFHASVNYTSEAGSASIDNPEVKVLQPGQSTVTQISGLLIEGSELPSLEMNAIVNYGGREAFLVKQAIAPVEIVSGPDWLLIALAVLAALLLLYWLFARKKEQKPVPTAAAPPTAPAEEAKPFKSGRKK